MQVLYYFGSSTKWNAQVNDQNEYSFTNNSNTTSPVVVSSYGVLSPSMIWYSSEM